MLFSWYRITMPLQELAKHDGFDITFADGGESEGRRSPVTASVLKEGNYDVIVGQRLNKHSTMHVWRGARTPQGRLVYEIDDDVYCVNRENWQAHSLFQREDIRDAITHHAQVSDLITVSTQHLAGVMAEATGNKNTAVCPTTCPAGCWTCPGGSGPGLRSAGRAGPRRRRRRPDRGSAAPVHQALRRLGPAGERHRLPADVPVPTDRASYVKWIPVNDDPRGYYETLDFDIGLAPLTGTEFDKSKSFVKALEYNARGIPVLATDLEPYRGYVKDGVNGFLIRQDHEWLKRLSELASDDALRARMSEQSKQCARIWTIRARLDPLARCLRETVPARVSSIERYLAGLERYQAWYLHAVAALSEGMCPRHLTSLRSTGWCPACCRWSSIRHVQDDEFGSPTVKEAFPAPLPGGPYPEPS